MKSCKVCEKREWDATLRVIRNINDMRRLALALAVSSTVLSLVAIATAMAR